MKRTKRKAHNKIYGKIKGPYLQKSIRERILALFSNNLGKIITREQIIKVSTDPVTKRIPENWHQRLSELRTDFGYSILSWRNKGYLKVQEYLMPDLSRRRVSGKRARPTDITWLKVLKRANYSCEWNEGGQVCGLRDGDIDPIGGGTVKITPDHKKPHSTSAHISINDPNQWQALCGRHQIIKKNYWDNNTGKLNVYAIIQSASLKEKHKVFKFLIDFFSYKRNNKTITKS